MNNKATTQLKYKSYEELKSSALSNFDKKFLFTLKQLDINRLFKHFVEVERKARIRNFEGYLEESFMCYQRASEIYHLINDKMTPEFKRGQIGRDFFNIANDMVNAINLLTDKLKLEYNSLYGIEKMNVDEDYLNETSLTETIIFDTYVKPSILLNYIEKNGSNVLILDYREDKRRYIKCNLKNGGEINIVQLEPSTIVLGSLLHCITKTLDISIRPLLEKISQYDFVILLGDLNDITNQNGTKTKILYEALTTYNRTNRLKHPPIILEEGFRGWELTYPCYTSSLEENIPIFEKTFDEMFSHYMEESKRVHRLNFTYPILKSDSETICPSSTKFSKTFSFADKLVPKRVFIDDERSYDNNKISIPVTSFDSTSSKPPQMVSLKNLPLIDRSKKPVVSSIDSKENDDNSIRDKENIIDHPSHINKRLALLPQVLGGARIASAGGPSVTTPAVHHHNNTPQHHHVHTPEVSRPTTPDRSTKKGILQSSQQIEPAAFFTSSYNYSVERILDDSSYKRMKIKPGHTGLVNMGNTCFMNATLQALFHTPYFSQLFRGHAVSNFINTNNTLGTKGIISGCFSALIDIIWSGEFSAIRPFSFLDMFAKRVNSTLADRQQHDAQEFQIYLLDALHEDTNRVNKKRPFEQNYDGSNLLASADDFIKQSRHFSSSPVNDIFNLLTVSVLQCKSCSTRSACFEGLNQISVELPNNNIESGRIFRLKECLNTHFSTTTLDTPWDCPNCKTKQTATRTTKIWSYPKILIIHLKRFSFNSGRFIKNEIDINFEIDNFDLAPYTHTKSTFLQNKVEYNLYAVTNHSGTLNSGHYTSNVKNLQNENEWLHFDDENCTRIRNLSSIVTKHAFLLYYVLGKNVSNDGKNALL